MSESLAGIRQFSKSLSDLLQALREQQDFEHCANQLLLALHSLGNELLVNPRFSDQARLLRGMVHLRPDGAYRELVVAEWSDVATQGDTAQLGPSMALWQFVADSRQPVTLDALTAQARLLTTANGGDDARISVRHPSPKSIHQMRERLTTHAIALPLLNQHGATAGMVTLELECAAAIGDKELWQPGADMISALVSAASPWLLAKPLVLERTEVDNFGLPVVGQRMREVLTLLDAFAKQHSTVLLTGPTGCGKSMLARAIHERSLARDGPFVPFTLLGVNEDQQLGHIKGWCDGVFPGARAQPGLLEMAEHGTFFLDEIDKLSMHAQAGLLSILSNGVYQKMGETKFRNTDAVRMIVATNANLRQEVAHGRFRQDLLYRIDQLSIHVPGIGERRDEVPGWVEYMLQRAHSRATLHARRNASQQEGEPASRRCHLSDGALSLLESQPWPGNLRQLDSILQRAYALALGGSKTGTPLTIDVEHVQQAFHTPQGADEHADHDVLESLRRAARLIAENSLSNQGSQPLADFIRSNNVLFALVWEELQRITDDPVRAAALVGKSRSVRSRNLAKEMRRERERIDSLERRLSKH